MRQEVNLYTRDFLPKREWLSFPHLLLLLLLFALSLTGYSYLSWQHAKALQASNITLREKNKLSEKNDESLTLIDRIIQKKHTLEQDLASAEQRVQNKQQIEAMYIHSPTTSVANLSAFYTLFLAIGKEAHANLSIEEIGAYNGGKEVIIYGYAIFRDDIPAYLQTLKKNSAFKQSHFGLLKIDRLKKSKTYRFTMARENALSRFIELSDSENPNADK